ncbi:MAG TPA: hypothetical protein VFV34_29440 [Blastocatellia bacterium]|nr:hypothetical protein [Blastocatellia bacterium]
MRPTAELNRTPSLLMLAVFVLSISAPTAAQSAGRGRLSITDVKQLPGELVADVQNTVPETAMRIRGYRVERVLLPQAQNVRIEGKRTTVQQAWRMTVFFSEPLTVRSQAFSLAIDGRWCGFLAESEDLMSADAICFNTDLVRDGARLGVTYRGVTIQQPSDADQAVNPLADLELEESEPIHYAGVPLRLKGNR